MAKKKQKIKPPDYWRQKLIETHGLPKVEKITGKMSTRWEKGTVAIPSPAEVDRFMKSVPKGKVTTINEIRSAVAKKHQATGGCPITTGIFSWIAAHASEEGRKRGQKRVTPYWRTLKEGGALNHKYPGGIALQARRLRAEGQKIEKGKGKLVYRVKDHEKKLAKLK